MSIGKITGRAPGRHRKAFSQSAPQLVNMNEPPPMLSAGRAAQREGRQPRTKPRRARRATAEEEEGREDRRPREHVYGRHGGREQRRAEKREVGEGRALVGRRCQSSVSRRPRVARPNPERKRGARRRRAKSKKAAAGARRPAARRASTEAHRVRKQTCNQGFLDKSRARQKTPRRSRRSRWTNDPSGQTRRKPRWSSPSARSPTCFQRQTSADRAR